MSAIAQPVALVTGSSRGIGRATALALGQSGHAVVVHYHRQADAAQDAKAALTRLGVPCYVVQGDVSQAKHRQRIIGETLETFGRLDTLVNNAGITSPGRRDLLEATEDSWDLVLATNLKAPFFLCQLAARSMIELLQQGVIPRGTLINVSSISAFAASTQRGDYCIAKAGLQMLSWLFAARLAGQAIRVFEVCPGIVDSDMTAPVHADYTHRITQGLTPMRRWGQPDDVARAIVALVSDAFPFSTGDRIHVDGGFHIRQL